MSARPAAPGPEDTPAGRMTIRISTDSGRTYGPAVNVDPHRDVVPDIKSAWPACSCPIHRSGQ